MGGAKSRRVLCYTLILPAVLTVSSLIFIQTCQALTASYGLPYNGYLVNGVVFPDMFPGYHLLDKDHIYTTPELAGAVLDAVEAVRNQFPGTCDVCIGDFSKKGGGRYGGHLSHQNGRDVDIGLYAKDNRPLHGLVPMNRDNLDPAKTLCLIQNVVASQRVQYIFLGRSIQKILYDYGLSHGYSQAYLNRLFGNVPGALVEDIPGHLTHMHVRFFTPWSTLAAHAGSLDPKMDAIIAVAQESYLPKKVDYYVTGSEEGLSQLAHSFGVTETELCSWNHLSPFSVLVPGSCLVFYKRSFESGPVLLANSLQPGYIAQAATPPIREASLQPESAPSAVSDSVDSAYDEPDVKPSPSEHHAAPISTFRTHRAGRNETLKSAAGLNGYYAVKSGGTLKDVSRKTGIPLSSLCRLNGLGPRAHLRRGEVIKLAKADAETATNARSRQSSSRICFASGHGKSGSITSAYYRVNHGGTLKDVAIKTGIPLSSLCRLNRLHRDAHLRHGQLIKLAQANLPVRPSFGRASCSIRYSAKKTSAVKHKVSHKKFLKSAKAKTVRKPISESRVSKHPAAAKRRAGARYAKTAVRKPAAPKAVKSGKQMLTKDPKRAAHSTHRVRTTAKLHHRAKLAKK